MQIVVLVMGQLSCLYVTLMWLGPQLQRIDGAWSNKG